MVISIIYTFLRLDWRTSQKQKPLKEAKNVITDFFDHQHVIATFKTIFKKRAIKRRAYLILLIIAMACYTFQRDEKNMSYLYLQHELKWNVIDISDLRTYQSALQDIVLVLAVPIMVKVFGIRDTIVIMIGTIGHSTARFFYAYGHVPWLIYLGNF